MLLHRYFIRNGTVLETGKYQPNTGIEIYEVVRVVKGIPLFLEDHLLRFYHSAWLCHLEIPLEEDEAASMLAELIRVNAVEEGNIRFSYCFRPVGNFQAYFIPHFYPDRAMVNEGVSCGVLHAERTDPNAKVVHINLRESANHMIQERGLYEVLLLNHHGEFTEGSRSNLFFLKDGVFVTAPSDFILPGITRQKSTGIDGSFRLQKGIPESKDKRTSRDRGSLSDRHFSQGAPHPFNRRYLPAGQRAGDP